MRQELSAASKPEASVSATHHRRRAVLLTLCLVLAMAGGAVSAVLAAGRGQTTPPTAEAAKTALKVMPSPIPPIPQPAPAPVPTPPTPTPTPTPTPAAKPVKFVADPASFTAVVNKKFRLPATYIPPGLREVSVPRAANEPLRLEAAVALEKLFSDAANEGVYLQLNSAYRSYGQQQALYKAAVAKHGQAAAGEYSAKPGYSEHQTGLAADVGQGGTPSKSNAYAWLAANAQHNGFIIRYLKGKEAITGYGYEPWHLRYVGIDLAKQLAASGRTLEEHFGLPGGDYE